MCSSNLYQIYTQILERDICLESILIDNHCHISPKRIYMMSCLHGWITVMSYNSNLSALGWQIGYECTYVWVIEHTWKLSCLQKTCQRCLCRYDLELDRNTLKSSYLKCSQPPWAWDGTKQWRNNPFTIYFLSNASIHLQLTCSSISRTVCLSWTMTLQESSDLWFQIPIDWTRGDSFHHQISQVLFSSSMLTRRPRTHFFLPLLLLLLCKWKPLTILALQALLYHLGKVLLCRSDHVLECRWML